MRLLRTLFNREEGQATAWFVGISLALFALMALSIDMGFMFHARRVSQNAADPGSLAGAAHLPGCALGTLELEPGEIEDVSDDYATRNLAGKTFVTAPDAVNSEYRPTGFQFTDDLGTFSYPTVYARVDRFQSYIFGRILGLVSNAVPAEAEAACLPTSGVSVCPFYLKAPDPDQDPFNPNEPFGVVYGDVYRFKDGGPDADAAPGNRGFLAIYGPGGNVINTAVENGCVPPDEDMDVYYEDGDPLTGAKQGTQASIWNSMDDLYSYENDGIGYGPESYCDIEFDALAFTESDGYFSTTPTDPDLAEKLVECARDPDPADNVSGRWWPILLTSTPCNGNSCDVNILAIAMMYVACWGPRCDGSPAGQAGLFGIFMDDVPFEIPNNGGVSNNPLAPKKVRLIR